MFNLNASIAAWRRILEHNRALVGDDLDELEQHLRDQISAFADEGMCEEEAFDRALHLMGDYSTAEQEYGKVYWKKVKQRKGLAAEIDTRMGMLRNYITTALRNLRRQKGYSFINVFGLALGIACCGIIGLYVHDELSYDRYQPDADRIYRVLREWEPIPGRDDALTLPSTAPPIMTMVREQFPQMRDAVRIVRGGETRMRYGSNEEFIEERIAFAEPSIFDLFAITLVHGDTATALSEPAALILSETMARKYFGDKNPLGETLTLDGGDAYRITGVMKDMPRRSHVHFDFIASWVTLNNYFSESTWSNWYSNFIYTYVRLSPENARRIPELEAQFARFMDTHEPEGNETNLRLQPLTSIHLHSQLPSEFETNGSIVTVRVFAVIAAIVLLIACINFINLTTARALERAKEVGVRKAIGAQRGQVMHQVLTESLVMAVAAFVLAILVSLVLLPFFRDISAKEIGIGVGFLAALAGTAMLVGLGAGTIPAIMLSGFQPVAVLRGKLGRASRGALFRKGLVVFQFTASVVLIVGTIIVYRQITFMRDTELGIDVAHVVDVELSDSSLRAQGEALADAFERVPGVEGTAFSWISVPGNIGSSLSLYHPGENVDASKGINHRTLAVSADFIDVLGIELLAGRFFSRDIASDSAAVVLNATSARKLGYRAEEAVGRHIDPSLDALTTFGKRTVIGVTDDFHFTTLEVEIPPLAITHYPNPASHLLVRLAPGDPTAILRGMREAWGGLMGDRPITYQFADDGFDALYREQERTGQLLTGFAILAVLIACLGLFGLATFTAQQRTKEIGIRKVLGATAPNVAVLLSRDFLKLVTLGVIVAVPLGYFASSKWLQGFAYRIDVGPGVFLAAGVTAIFIALATVSFQAARAAILDPVKSLRYE